MPGAGGVGSIPEAASGVPGAGGGLHPGGSIRCARGRGAGSIPARAGGGLHGGSLSCAQGWGAANQAHGLTHVHSWLGPQAGP